MKIHSLVFSPTGTSAKIARAIADGILQMKNDAGSFSDATRQPLRDSFGQEDLVVMAAPVYGGKMAPLAKERFRDVKGRHTPCVLVAVYGNRAFENALRDMADFARNRGFVPVAAAAFVGEHSYSSARTPVAAGRPDDSDLKAAGELGMAIARKVQTGNLSPVEPGSLRDEVSSEKSLRNFRNFVKEYQQQRKNAPVQYLPELNPALCNGCGTCAQACPTAAIGAKGQGLEAEKCIRCCACVKVCPSGARSFFTPFASVLAENFNVRKSPVWQIG